jgi:hypothetical protein
MWSGDEVCCEWLTTSNGLPAFRYLLQWHMYIQYMEVCVCISSLVKQHSML